MTGLGNFGGNDLGVNKEMKRCGAGFDVHLSVKVIRV